MTQDLKDLYHDLVQVLDKAGVAFWDTDLFGPGVTISVKTMKAKHVIVIGNSKTWKRRVFVLAHEIGHLFHVVRGTDTNGLTLRKSIGSEEAANKTACSILDEVDPELKKEYAQLYNYLNRKTRRKKFKP